MPKTSIRIAMIIFHTCPLAAEEGKETGGANVYVLELSRQLANMGYSVDIFTRSQYSKDPPVVEISPNLRVIHLPAGPREHIENNKLTAHIPEFTDNFFEFTKKEKIKYDLLHCHYYLGGLAGNAINRKLTNKIPLVMSFHTLALMKNLVARDELEKESLNRIQSEMDLTKTADSIVSVSDNDYDYLRYLYQTDLQKLVLIPPGVDIGLFKPMDKLVAKKQIHADPEHKIVLFVGRIRPLKGIDALLYAMKIFIEKNPRLTTCLWVVGEDVSQNQRLWSKQLQYLNELKHILGISTFVKFMGQKKQPELVLYYNAADLLVAPSHYESFGMVALEAMACGTPVITTNVAGVSTILGTNKDALITTVNNPLQLADQIELLLTDKKEYQRLSRHLLNKSRQYGWKKIAEQISLVYTDCLAAD